MGSDWLRAPMEEEGQERKKEEANGMVKDRVRGSLRGRGYDVVSRGGGRHEKEGDEGDGGKTRKESG